MSTNTDAISINSSSASIVAPEARPSGEVRLESSAQAPQSRAGDTSDAVKVLLSSSAPATDSSNSSSNTTASSAAFAENEKASIAAEKKQTESAQKAAEDAAKSFEDLINKISPTQVKFGVSVSAEVGKAINFRVVEKESGKVVREFPPESLREMKTMADRNGGNGLLINQAA